MKLVCRICAAALLAALFQTGAGAQTMRFETSVGSFDMILNPTNNANLQPLVDNIVAYIGLGRYHYTAINRAVDGIPGPGDTDDDFVLQMGGFLGFPPTPENFLGLVQEVQRLNPVTTDANGDGDVDFTTLENTRGTVSLALSAGNPNSGTSSFFINLGDNSELLDPLGFVPFARIDDMSTIDRIMLLNQTDLDGPPANITFDDVPLTEEGRLVILKSVRVLQSAPNFSFTGPIAAALNAQSQAQNNVVAASQLAEEILSAENVMVGEDELVDLPIVDPLPAPASSGSLAAVPEPSAGALLAMALAGLAARRRRR
jgi:cyclophilin family peptidyl-prolyl cis-trans isomerase